MPSGCPGGRMRLSSSTASRGLVVLRSDSAGVLSTFTERVTLALASCSSCRRRVRVLPCDILPGKTYSLQVIEKVTIAYAAGDRTLRDLAWGLPGDRSLSHTTLHAWTEGLGAHALGRPGGGLPGADPSSRLLSETAARRPGLDTTIDTGRFVDERRFRSKGRMERLAAMGSVLSIAAAATGMASPLALTEWRRLALTWTGSDALRFSTGILCTRIDQVGAREAARSTGDAPSQTTTPCRPRSRSPPGDSSSFSLS